MAHLYNGSLEGAAEEAARVFSLAPELRVSTVTEYMARLDRRLGNVCLKGNKIAGELRVNIQEFNQTALPD